SDYLDGAPMRRDKFEHDRQADAGAFDGGALRGPASIESFEHVFTILHGDTGPVVGHVEHKLRPGRARLQVNRASFRGILDRVRYQVFENEPDFAAIRDKGDVVDTDVQTHTLGKEGELLVLQHLFHHGTQAEFTRVEADARGLPGAEGEQVFDHALQFDTVLAKDAGHFALVGVQLTYGAVHEQLRAFPNVGEWRFELMRH